MVNITIRLVASLVLIGLAWLGVNYVRNTEAVYERTVKKLNERRMPYVLRLGPIGARRLIRATGCLAIVIAILYLVLLWNH